MEYVKTNSKGKLDFPKTLPRDRKHLADVLFKIVALIFFTFATFWQSFSSTLFLSSLCIIFLAFVEVLKRIGHTVEEYRDHLPSRYGNDWQTLIAKTWHCEQRAIVTFFVAISVLFIGGNQHDVYSPDLPHLAAVATAIALISKHFHFGKSSLRTSLQITDLNGLDYGSGMAHSFFHGYLKINLNPDGGLVELMHKYESREQVQFHNYKLFILLPLSMHCPHSLQSDFSPSVETASSLESITKDRAGVKGRVYKNSVYKITYQHKGDSYKLYVAAEYATPLKTFEEVVRSNGHCSAYYKEHIDDIIYNFYYTLKRLIDEDPETTNICEIIYYNDKDENGKFIDVGEMLKKKLASDEAMKKSLSK